MPAGMSKPRPIPSCRLTCADVCFVEVDFPRRLQPRLVIEFSEALSLLREDHAAIPLAAEFVAAFRKDLTAHAQRGKWPSAGVFHKACAKPTSGRAALRRRSFCSAASGSPLAAVCGMSLQRRAAASISSDRRAGSSFTPSPTASRTWRSTRVSMRPAYLEESS
jgi:hypothetical protein